MSADWKYVPPSEDEYLSMWVRIRELEYEVETLVAERDDWKRKYLYIVEG